MVWRTILALAAVFTAATPSRGETFLGLYSQAGDVVGGGRYLVLTEMDGEMAAEHERGHVRVEFTTHSGKKWQLDFAARRGEELRLGAYEGAVLHPADRPAPALSVMHNQTPCTRITGRFVVLVLDLYADGSVSEFAATFEQRCNAAAAPLYGTVSFRSALPLPATRTPTPTPSRFQTFVLLDSEPGDAIGGGRYRELRPQNGIFVAVHAPGSVQLKFDGGGSNRWTFTFQAPVGQELVPGVYENARRYLTQPPIWPGLDVSRGTGCNFLTGRFAVLAAEYGPDNRVVSFAANFEQHCEGMEPALRGVIRFSSDIAAGAPTPTPPSPTPTPELYTTYIHLESEPGDYVGGGQTRTLLPSFGLITAHYADGVLNVHFDGDEDWQLYFAAPRGQELVAGIYPNVEGYPFHSPARGGLSVSGGRGCGVRGSEFVVHEAEFRLDGSVKRFAANFEQYCEDAEAALRGWVRINSTLAADHPTPTPRLPSPTPARAAHSARLYSDPGEYLGEGRAYVLSEDEGIFTATHEVGHVQVRYEGGGNSWEFHFAAPLGYELAPGAYELAQGWPFQWPRRPGLGVAPVGQGRGCSRITGRFDVLEAAYGANGAVDRFAIDFIARCEGSLVALHGSVRIGSARAPKPPPRPTATAVPDSAYIRTSGLFNVNLTRRHGSFSAQKVGSRVAVIFENASTSWILSFTPPECTDLSPGVYSTTPVGPSGSAARPAFDISVGSTSCTEPDPEFEILKIEIGPDGEVLRFAADFRTSCFDLTGSVRYTSLLPTPVPTSTPPPFRLNSIALLESEPGDYIGACRDHVLTLATGFFAATHDGNSVRITYVGESLWSFRFAARRGQTLVPGTYEGASGYRPGGGEQPGLEVAGEGRGCDRISGRFVVHEAVLGPEGEIERFAAELEQYCGSQGKLSGIVRYNSALPTSYVRWSPTPTPTARLPPCAGDCGGDGAVTVSDLVGGVAIALGQAPLDLCPAADGDGDGAVSVSELLSAVNRSLSGCVVR